MTEIHVLKANGMEERKRLRGKPTLRQMQALVGGLIEPIALEDGRVMLVNEEGLLHHLSHNERASQLAGRFIVGNVLVMQEEDFT